MKEDIPPKKQHPFIAKLDKEHLDWDQTQFPEPRVNGNLAL